MTPPSPLPQSLVTEVFQQINTFRKSKGLVQLAYDPGLAAQAQAHSVDMARQQRIDHDGFAQRIEAVHPNTAAAENVEYNQYTDAQDVVQQWINSPPHRANMLGSYDLVGLGSSTGTDGNDYWTATFDYFQES